MKRGTVLLAWWFASIAGTGYTPSGIATAIGPFKDEAQCWSVHSELRQHATVKFTACWWDGRP